MEKVSLNSQFYFLKKAMKILLPVSIFSLVFSQSYSSLPSLFHSLHEYSSYFSIQLFTYSSERNYIFLLCNGILVFIIKNSGLINPNISDHHHQYPKESHKEFKSRESKNQETKIEFLEDYQEDDVEIIEELEEDEEELEETLEELHKKCDDFIKRNKKEINRKNSS